MTSSYFSLSGVSSLDTRTHTCTDSSTRPLWAMVFVSDQRLSFNRQECQRAGERKNQEIKVLCLGASGDADALKSVESSGLVL